MTERQIEQTYILASKTAFDNAVKLLEESKILQSANHNARSYALSILSMEEISKTLLYRCVSVGLFEEQKIRKFIFDHQNKIQHSRRVMIIWSMIADHSKEIIQALEHDETKEHKDHIAADVYITAAKKAIKSLKNPFSNAHFTKLEAIYVDVKEGKVLDPNVRIEESKAIESISIIEKILPFLKATIDLNNDDFVKTMKDQIFQYLIKIDFN